MKKALFILLPLLLIGGAVIGLGMLGIVNVPFLPLAKKKKVKVPPDDGKGGPFAKLFSAGEAAIKRAEAAQAEAKKKPVAKDSPSEKPDSGPGEAKLAILWAELPPDKLVALTEKWPEPSLGRILSNMDADTTTELLAALPAPRAAKLSQAIAAATDEATQKVHADLKN